MTGDRQAIVFDFGTAKILFELTGGPARTVVPGTNECMPPESTDETHEC